MIRLPCGEEIDRLAISITHQRCCAPNKKCRV